MPSAIAAAPSTASPLPPNGPGVRPPRRAPPPASCRSTGGERAGDEHGVAVAALLRVAREQRLGVEVVDGHAGRQGRASRRRSPSSRPRPSCDLAVGVDGDDRAVRAAQRGVDEVADAAELPTAGDGAAGGRARRAAARSASRTRGRRPRPGRCTSWRAVVTSDRRAQPRGHRGGEHEHAERDRHHGDDQPRAQPTPRPGHAASRPAHRARCAGLGASRRYPTPRTVVITTRSPSFLRTCAMCTSTVRASPNQS